MIWCMFLSAPNMGGAGEKLFKGLCVIFSLSRGALACSLAFIPAQTILVFMFAA